MVDGSKPTNLEELMPEVENRIDAVHRIVGWIRAHSYIIRRVRRIGWRGAGVQPGDGLTLTLISFHFILKN